jgi:Peptidase inhibitor family I36
MKSAIRTGTVLLAVPTLLGVFAGTATAGAAVTPANEADFSDCPEGFVCFYTGRNGGGDMCRWQSADSNHHPECSWAGSTKVRSIYNHGTDQAFLGVCVYSQPDYVNNWAFSQQGSLPFNTSGDFKALSHKWIRPGDSC